MSDTTWLSHDEAEDLRGSVGWAAHPVADLFPMLADDELQELAADIAERGLLQPIVLDTEGRVLDGRNRLAACEIAEIEPAFTIYDGDDPDGYALAVNIARRHLNKGQIALVAARATRIRDEYDQEQAATDHDVSQSRISKANVVLDHAPDLADSVVSGAVSLDKAYEQARKNKENAASIETRMAKLRIEASDLAEQVIDETNPMTLDEATAALTERIRKWAEDRRDARALLTRIVDLTAPTSASNGFVDSWARQLGDLDAELSDLVKRAEQASQVLLDLAERVKQ